MAKLIYYWNSDNIFVPTKETSLIIGEAMERVNGGEKISKVAKDLKISQQSIKRWIEKYMKIKYNGVTIVKQSKFNDNEYKITN